MLTRQEKLLLDYLRAARKSGIGQSLHLNIHLDPIGNGSEEHNTILSVSEPVPIGRIRVPMLRLMEDIKEGNQDRDFLLLLQYDAYFKMLKLLKLTPLITL